MEVWGGTLAKSLAILTVLLLFCAPVFSQYVCPPGANSTIVKVDYSHDPLKSPDSADASIYVYMIDRTLSPPKDVGVKEGLVILASGAFVPGPNKAYGLPDPDNIGQNSVCRMVTDNTGHIKLTLPHPKFTSQCVSHRFIYCPATLDSVKLAQCAGLVDAGNNRIKDLDWRTIPPCPGTPASAAPFTEEKVVNGKIVTTDQTALFDSSQNQLQVCGDTAGSPGQMQLCWVGALAFGLLFAASFMSGRNPLQMFDFGTARSIGTRMGTTTGGPPPMQQYAFAPPVSGLISMADRSANIAFGDRSAKAGVRGKTGLVSSKINKLINKAADGLTEGVGIGGKKDDKDVKISSAVNSVVRGVVMGAITGGMVGLVNLASGKRGGWKKAGKTAISAAVPYIYKAAGTMAGRGLDELTKAASKGSDLRNVENKPPELSPQKFADAATKAIESKYGFKKGSVEVVANGAGGFNILHLVRGRTDKAGKTIPGRTDNLGQITFNPNGTATGAVSRKPGGSDGHILNFAVSKSGEVGVKLVTPVSNEAKNTYKMMVGGREQEVSSAGVASDWLKAVSGDVCRAVSDIAHGGNVWDALSEACLGTFSVSSSAPTYTIANAHQDIAVGKANLQLLGGKITAPLMDNLVGPPELIGTYNKEGPLVFTINSDAEAYKLGGLVPGHSYLVADAGGTSQPPLDITDHLGLQKGQPEMQPVDFSASKPFTINGDQFVSAKNDDGTFTLTNSATNESYTAKTDANGAISLTDSKGKSVDSILANGASFDFHYSGAEPNTILVNTYGTFKGSFEAKPWEADFFDASGQPMTYAGTDGKPMPVKNLSDMAQATFLPALEDTLDKFITEGFSRGLKMGPFTTVNTHAESSTGNVLTDALFDYTASAALSAEFMRNPILSDVQRTEQENMEKAREAADKIRESDEAQKAYADSHLEEDKKAMARKSGIGEEYVTPGAVFGSKFEDLEDSPGFGSGATKPDLMQLVENPLSDPVPSDATEQLESLLNQSKGILEPKERQTIESEIRKLTTQVAQEALEGGTLLPGGASKAFEIINANRYYDILEQDAAKSNDKDGTKK
ncbi:MAG: hypothetical protein V1728_04155 [Candidatus Micrarchaeota archaeon]